MEKTYWNNNGSYQDLSVALRNMIPDEGRVKEPRKNAKLDLFRRASNCYYDIFNNGGCNRRAEIRNIFDIRFSYTAYSDRNPNRWDNIHATVEPIMDKIILEAASEQGLISRPEYAARVFVDSMSNIPAETLAEIKALLNAQVSA